MTKMRDRGFHQPRCLIAGKLQHMTLESQQTRDSDTSSKVHSAFVDVVDKHMMAKHRFLLRRADEVG
jgi:hypothetical protein